MKAGASKNLIYVEVSTHYIVWAINTPIAASDCQNMSTQLHGACTVEPFNLTLTERLFDVLQRAIVEGEIAPGSKISEPELARQQGVCANLPVAEATALLGRADHTGAGATSASQAGLHLETHDAAEDRAALVKLAAWCHRFSPLVGLEEAAAPDTLLLNVTGVTPLFGSEPMFKCKPMRINRIP